MTRNTSIEQLKGLVLRSVTKPSESNIIFVAENGDTYEMYHPQDCCEYVTIDDINGDLESLIGNPLLVAEERTNTEGPNPNYEEFTWTFYTLATVKGWVDIRWYGSSNGYYSEHVEVIKH